MQYHHRDALVSTGWLADHLEDPELRIFECTMYLDYLPPGQDAPYRVVSGRADYEKAHIPGAGFIDLQNELSDCSSPPHLRFTMLLADKRWDVAGLAMNAAWCSIPASRWFIAAAASPPPWLPLCFAS